MTFTYLTKEKMANIPQTPGVYVFKNKEGVLYIGKAGNLRTRVRTHFSQPTWRDNLFIDQVTTIGYESLTSEIEALLKEADLIRGLNPRYNVMWRDNKNFFYVEITKDPLPRILLVHQKTPGAMHVGPFVDGRSIKRTLRTLRWVFPFTAKKRHGVSSCQECNLGLCPGPSPDLKAYGANIRKLTSVLSGKRQSVARQLEKEMKTHAKAKNFEMAARKRDQLQALTNVFEHARVLQPLPLKRPQAFWPKLERELREVVGAS
ncbi:MAG: GIY-YIG nuclease family protein, partial [bacterium]|nr:GIY-YIG nuclease family protein [bacterium]